MEKEKINKLLSLLNENENLSALVNLLNNFIVPAEGKKLGLACVEGKESGYEIVSGANLSESMATEFLKMVGDRISKNNKEIEEM